MKTQQFIKYLYEEFLNHARKTEEQNLFAPHGNLLGQVTLYKLLVIHLQKHQTANMFPTTIPITVAKPPIIIISTALFIGDTFTILPLK